MYIQRERWYGGHLICGLVDHWLVVADRLLELVLL